MKMTARSIALGLDVELEDYRFLAVTSDLMELCADGYFSFLSR